MGQAMLCCTQVYCTQMHDVRHAAWIVSCVRVLLAALLFMYATGCVSRSDLQYESSDVEDGQTAKQYTSGGDEPESPAGRLPAIQPISGKSETANSGKSETANNGITIQPDCLVQIKVKDDPSLDGNYPVNDIGAVELGYVGPVILYNMTAKGAAQKIKEILDGRYFRNAFVEVLIKRASYDKIQVSGAVNKPGLIRIGAGDTISLNDALLRAGGVKASAIGAKVRIVRAGLLSALPTALEGEEYPLINDPKKPTVAVVFLRNNDIAYVFSTEAEAAVEVGDKEILVLGEVSKQGNYRFSGTEPCTMMNLILNKMNGLPPYANQKAVKVVRRNGDGSEEEFKVNVEQILERGDPQDDFPLQNGDRVLVPARRLSLF
jgi:protein involved in polysaccharide export with SLBB domain